MRHSDISTQPWNICTRRRAIGSGIVSSVFSLASAAFAQQSVIVSATQSLASIAAYIGGASSPYNSGNYAGPKTLLTGELTARFAPIAERADPESLTAVFIVEPPSDSRGRPRAQLATACSFACRLDDFDYEVIFVTRYMRDGLNDAQLLAILAHEAGHFRQTRDYRRTHPSDIALKHFHFSRGLESDADAWALSAPEVDPREFKSMIETLDRLNDQASKKHPGLAKSGLGTTVFIPYSVQTRLELGWDHPTSGSRIKAADREIQRRGL